MIEIVLIACVLCVCIGIGYWLVVRPMRQLQVTVSNLQGFYSATQNTLTQSQ
jgi:predicted permease